MIVAVWHRWVQQGQWWWLLVLAAVLAVDLALGMYIAEHAPDLGWRYWRWVTGT